MEAIYGYKEKLYRILKNIGRLYSKSTDYQASLLSLVTNEFDLKELINNEFQNLNKRKYHYAKNKNQDTNALNKPKKIMPKSKQKFSEEKIRNIAKIYFENSTESSKIIKKISQFNYNINNFENNKVYTLTNSCKNIYNIYVKKYPQCSITFQSFLKYKPINIKKGKKKQIFVIFVDKYQKLKKNLKIIKKNIIT